jgi:hypothetical protein
MESGDLDTGEDITSSKPTTNVSTVAILGDHSVMEL